MNTNRQVKNSIKKDRNASSSSKLFAYNDGTAMDSASSFEEVINSSDKQNNQYNNQASNMGLGGMKRK